MGPRTSNGTASELLKDADFRKADTTFERDYDLKITDTLLVTVTFLLFAATLALWLATRRLVKNGENTAKRQLRAYIVATIKGWDVPETSEGIFTFHLAI